MKLRLLMLMGLIVGILGLTSFNVAAQQRTSENFIFVNYIGQEIILDVDDVTYTVPGVDVAPEGGRLALTLDQGEHKFAANVPGAAIGSGGEFTITGDEIVAKAAHLQETGPVLDANGLVLEKPRDEVFVFDFDPFAVAVEEPVIIDTWQPTVPASGNGSLVWINHWGNDPLTVDIEGTLYSVEAGSNEIPGRLQLDFAPGTYRYTVSVPYGSVNGEVQIVAGEVAGIIIYADEIPEPEFEIGEESPLPLAVPLRQSPTNLTDQVAETVEETTSSTTEADSAPLTLPNTGEVLPDLEPIPSDDGVLLKNYAGGALVFTIDNETYVIDDHTDLQLNLTPGTYSYTASLPFVATTGIVDVVAGSPVELSIVLNVERDFLTIYQN